MEFVTALRTKSFDAGKPSLFELLSEQQLNSLLPPTLRYLLTVATQRYPRHLLRILNSFDELYVLAGLLVEGHYLRTRGGIFTEHFYNLKREKVPLSSAPPASSSSSSSSATTAISVSGDNPLPRASAAAPSAVRDALRLRTRDIVANLAVSVVLPYLQRKLDDAYDADAPRALLGSAYNTLPANATWRERARHWFRLFLRRGYRWLHAVCGLAALAFNLAYLFDGSRFHHPLLWLVGTRVRRMTAADHRAIEMLEKGAAAERGRRGLGARALGGLSVLLPASIFALKFLEWWHASDFARQLSRRAAESLELPPPAVAGLGEADGKARGRPRHASAVSTSSSAGSARSQSSRQNQDEDHEAGAEERAAKNAPIATPSMLPVYTVSAPADSRLCPICEDEIATPTACQTGVVYCYTCIHRWMAGTHARQERFMAGREGRWESGAGRCAVTGRRVLGGTEGLRRIMV